MPRNSSGFAASGNSGSRSSFSERHPHTRFAHRLGVFHTARSLVGVIERELKGDFDPNRADVAVISALLHDLGHGPFSHTFEGVPKSLGVRKRHEQWTAEIIRNPDGRIRPVLEPKSGSWVIA